MDRAVFTERDSLEFFHLAAAENIHTADFGDPDIFATYMQTCLEIAVSEEPHAAKAEWPRHVEGAVARVRALHELTEQRGAAPSQLVEVVGVLTEEFIKELKHNSATMHELRPRQFEQLVAEVLASYGWQVHLTPSVADGGYDIFAISKDITGIESSWIVECKKYSAERRVGVGIVRALYGLKTELRGVGNAMLATTSGFTRNAKAYKASRYDLDLRDYQDILHWINSQRESRIRVHRNRIVLPGDPEYIQLDA